MKRPVPLFLFLAFSMVTDCLSGAPPVVSNVRAAQRPGTSLVDILYDVSDPDGNSPLRISFLVSADGGATWAVPVFTFQGAVGPGVVPGNNRAIVWSAGVDWAGQFNNNCRVRVCAEDGKATAPSGMVLISAGSFTMGDTFSDGSGERPTHTVYVSAFYMDRTDVTKALWDEVYTWALSHGYSFEYGAQGKAANHPAHSMTWYDAVKWCNARSEKENRTPAYYWDAGLTQRYLSGQVLAFVNWTAGYRLPTEAEWEKAARGGASGRRFPWGDTITHSWANYAAYPSGYGYDINPSSGYHPSFQAGGEPYTSPVGYFASNGYGLYDMAGNVYQWCWDLYGAYGSAAQSDPRGSATGSLRVLRGGGWGSHARYCRSAYRNTHTPSNRSSDVGFRCVAPSSQP